MDRAELDRALESERYTSRLERDTLVAHQRGVSGVPAFFLGEHSFSGAQSEAMMREIRRRHVTTMGAPK